MRYSTFIVPPENAHLLSVGYQNGGGTIDAATPAREHLGRGYKVPNGGIYSNVGDLALFIAGMTGASGDMILSGDLRTKALTRQTPQGGAGYGFGFSLQTLRGVAIAVARARAGGRDDGNAGHGLG